MSKVYRSCRWIVEKLTKHQRLSFDEINEMWMEDDDISNGAELNKRTFHRYQEVLKDVFGIKVVSRIGGDYARGSRDGSLTHVRQPSRASPISLIVGF